jgi:hypothetical protein
LIEGDRESGQNRLAFPSKKTDVAIKGLPLINLTRNSFRAAQSLACWGTNDKVKELKQVAFLYQLKVQPERDILEAGPDRKSRSSLLT